MTANQFTPDMIGQVVEVRVLHSYLAGSNGYYGAERRDVPPIIRAGRLAEYSLRSFTFEPVGGEKPTSFEWPQDKNSWPDDQWRVEIDVVPAPSSSVTDRSES